jgi:hypothetical protein
MAKTTTSVMSRVNGEVEQIWGDSSSHATTSLGDGSKRYSSGNVDTWLLHWHLFSQEADHKLPWALVRADILQAISKMPRRIQEFFEYYCVLGYDFEEISEITGCKVSSCRYYWSKLKSSLMRILNDQRIIAHPVNKDLPCPINSLSAYSCEGRFDEPVLTEARKY